MRTNVSSTRRPGRERERLLCGLAGSVVRPLETCAALFWVLRQDLRDVTDGLSMAAGLQEEFCEVYP